MFKSWLIGAALRPSFYVHAWVCVFHCFCFLASRRYLMASWIPHSSINSSFSESAKASVFLMNSLNSFAASSGSEFRSF